MCNPVDPELGQSTFQVEGDMFVLDLKTDECGRNVLNEEGGFHLGRRPFASRK